MDKRWEGRGGRRMWIKKFPNVNIINFEKVDKPEARGHYNTFLVFYCETFIEIFRYNTYCFRNTHCFRNQENTL